MRSTCERLPFADRISTFVYPKTRPPVTWPHHGVVRALARLLALQFVGERGQGQNDLVGRRVERPLAVLEKEYAQARCDDLPERVGRLDRLAPEALSSEMMSTSNGARGLKAFISRRNPGRLANSVPEMPSSTKTPA